MKALRIYVERIVRPIQAGLPRKDRMREELLAHLTRLFEEELSGGGDVETATARAIRRFGEAAALRRELQASVSWLERVAFFNFGGPIRRRVGETPRHYVLRITSWAAGVSVVAIASMASIIVLLPNRRPPRADQITGGGAFAFLMCFAAIQVGAMFGMALLSEGIRQGLERRSCATTVGMRRGTTWRLIGLVAASSALTGAVSAGGMGLIDAFIPISFIPRAWFWGITVASTVAGPMITWKQAVDWRAATRRFDAWESLDLDESQTA